MEKDANWEAQEKGKQVFCCILAFAVRARAASVAFRWYVCYTNTAPCCNPAHGADFSTVDTALVWLGVQEELIQRMYNTTGMLRENAMSIKDGVAASTEYVEELNEQAQQDLEKLDAAMNQLNSEVR